MEASAEKQKGKTAMFPARGVGPLSQGSTAAPERAPRILSPSFQYIISASDSPIKTGTLATLSPRAITDGNGMRKILPNRLWLPNALDVEPRETASDWILTGLRTNISPSAQNVQVCVNPKFLHIAERLLWHLREGIAMSTIKEEVKHVDWNDDQLPPGMTTFAMPLETIRIGGLTYRPTALYLDYPYRPFLVQNRYRLAIKGFEAGWDEMDLARAMSQRHLLAIP